VDARLPMGGPYTSVICSPMFSHVSYSVAVELSMDQTVLTVDHSHCFAWSPIIFIFILAFDAYVS
jgi:hypothetical protein